MLLLRCNLKTMTLYPFAKILQLFIFSKSLFNSFLDFSEHQCCIQSLQIKHSVYTFLELILIFYVHNFKPNDS